MVRAYRIATYGRVPHAGVVALRLLHNRSLDGGKVSAKEARDECWQHGCRYGEDRDQRIDADKHDHRKRDLHYYLEDVDDAAQPVRLDRVHVLPLLDAGAVSPPTRLSATLARTPTVTGRTTLARYHPPAATRTPRTAE